MVRVSGGFIVLNYDRHRQKDESAADRMRRMRERKAALRVTGRNVTQAETEGRRQKAEARKKEKIGMAVPDSLQFTDTHRLLAKELGLDLANEFSQFRDHHTLQRTRCDDWSLKLNIWLRKAASFKHHGAAPRKRGQWSG